MEAAAHYCQPKENPRKAEEEIALARKVAMIAAKAGARPAAADYGMSQEQFASVMSGGYSAAGNEGQALKGAAAVCRRTGWRCMQCCTERRQQRSAVWCSGDRRAKWCDAG